MPKKPIRIPNLTPTAVLPDEQWRRLFDLANRLRKAEPWLTMSESDFFGIQMPGTGETVFVSVMGLNGEHLALAVWPTVRDLHGFLKIAYGRPGRNTMDVMCDTRQTQVTFGNKGDLLWYEKSLVERLGLKFTGRMAWPLFRNISPGWLPWAIRADDARWLETAMEQVLAVEEQMFGRPGLLRPNDGDGLLVRVPSDEGEGLVWRDTVQPLPPPPAAVGVPLDADDLRTLRALPQRESTVEFDVFPTMAQVAETRWERPQSPYLMLAVDKTTLFAFGTQFLTVEKSLDGMRSEVPSLLAAALRDTGFRPSKLAVCKPWLFELLEGSLRDAGVKVAMTDRLPALAEVRRDLEAQFG